MGQRKGQTGNPNGRPKGTPNRHTADLREKINTIIDKQIDNIETDLDSLEPMQRLQIVEKLISYCVPKLSSVSVEAQVQAEYLELEKLLEKCPEEIIDVIIEKINTLKPNDNEQE